jgi:tetratricopeptide (TPR) repeat protein
MSADLASKAPAAADDAQLASAIRRAEERLAREPASVAFAQLADLYRKAGRARDAIAVSREGLARYPKYTTARLILAKSLADDGDVDGALRELETMLAINRKDLLARRLAAELERRRGRVDAAAAHLEFVVAGDASDRESRALLALLRAAPGANDASALARVLRDDTFVTRSFGAVCLEQGAADEAAVVFTRLLRRNPNDAGARDGLEQALRAHLRRKG